MYTHGLLIVDLDNTVYNFVDYFGPSFRAMVHALHKETRSDYEDIIADFKIIFQRYNTVERVYAISEMPILQKYDRETRNRIIGRSLGAFHRAGTKNLHAYTGVATTLQWAKNERLRLFALSNAPQDEAVSKLQKMGLLNLFEEVVAWKGRARPTRSIPLNQMGLFDEFRNWPYERADLKPSRTPYRDILRFSQIAPADSVVVGDSIYKDLAPAKDLGIHSVWARYGTVVNEKNRDTLKSITSWTPDEVARTYSEDLAAVDFTIDEFSDLRLILATIFDKHELRRRAR